MHKRRAGGENALALKNDMACPYVRNAVKLHASMEEQLPADQQANAPVVWQHNRLADARYELTVREQKLLLYIISQIKSDDDELKRCTVNIGEFAEIAGLDKRHLYTELRELTEGLKSKVLVIPNHHDLETGKTLDLITSWFDAAFLSPNGEGYFAVQLSQNLKPYLLQVKREFYQFRLDRVMRMRSSYAIRFYQWLKRWAFRKEVTITVGELRKFLGIAVTTAGRSSPILGSYGSFKRRALAPAVTEINNRSDILVSYVERKKPGTKAVEAITFTIEANPNADRLEQVPLLFASNTEEEHMVDDEEDVEDISSDSQLERYIGSLKAKYALTETQVSNLREKYANRIEYLQDKERYVDSVKHPNKAALFLKAVKEDYTTPASKKQRAKKASVSSSVEELKLTPADEETSARVAKQLKEFQEALANGQLAE